MDQFENNRGSFEGNCKIGVYINSAYGIMNAIEGDCNMEYKIFEFPTEVDGLKAVEEKLCELMVKYRDGPLDPIELDYMDWANSVVMTSDAR